jgi:hypothetical protein
MFAGEGTTAGEPAKVWLIVTEATMQTTINKAVNLWIENKADAIKKYGHISNWDTSNQTSNEETRTQAVSYHVDTL